MNYKNRTSAVFTYFNFLTMVFNIAESNKNGNLIIWPGIEIKDFPKVIKINIATEKGQMGQDCKKPIQ